ncbi:L-ribulose-5-phosphate 4-epimerase [Weissella diestrammenae]|nr:L-ribulose-5-phosphate 4-epimerase [Weissella diestrammenae]
MLEEMKQRVYDANMLLPKYDLVTFTWGNVSEIDREKGLFVIKPSGVDYDQLRPEDMVVVDLKGNVVEGDLNPSSDTPTHMYLYNAFPAIGGVVHTHSPWAVSFAQAGLDLPAFGTTHADTFYGNVPAASALTEKEVTSAYELNTGVVIAREFAKRGLDPMAVPAVLVRQHGPFTWGKDAHDAVHNAKVLEVVAEMDYHSLQLNPHANLQLPQYLLDKHYYRKHGANAYYGQGN